MGLITQILNCAYGHAWLRQVIMTDDPPKIPAITGVIPKKKKDSFAEVLSNAALTLAQAIKPADITVSGGSSSLVVNQTSPPKPLQTTNNVSGNGGNGISPGRTTELRIKKLQEIRNCSSFWKKM